MAPWPIACLPLQLEFECFLSPALNCKTYNLYRCSGGPDFPVAHAFSTGTWDWNVGLESLIVSRPYNTLSTLPSLNPEVGTSYKQSMGGCWIDDI